MEQSWKISAWGVRGSTPAAEKRYMEYGGNTSCFCVQCAGETVVFDAGSGLTALGRELARQGKRQVHLFLSHLHIDHLLGLFTFPLLHEPDAAIHLYGPRVLREGLSALLAPPYWPVALEDAGARICFHEAVPGHRFPLAGGSGLWVSALRGRHPNGCLYYRLEDGERSVVYALDCEPDAAFAPALASFASGCGLLIWDAHFAPDELRKGWGHSTWEQGIELARTAGAGWVLMAHYEQSYDDEFLREQERLAAAADARCLFAKEGMVIEL